MAMIKDGRNIFKNGEPYDTQHLMHELEVNETTLKHQNEQLIEAQEELRVANDEMIFIQDELRRTRDRYIDMFINAPVAYFTVDLLNNRITEVNFAAADLLQATRSYIIHKRLIKFVDPAFTDTFHFCIRKTLEEPHRGTCELKMQTINGQSFWALMNVAGITQSKQIRIAVIDITDRKKAEQIKDDFIGMVSHELRTPLTIIMGSIKVARSEGLTTDEIGELLKEADGGTESLSHILDNLIELSRYQSNRLSLSRVRSNIHDIIREIVKFESDKLDKNRLQMELPAKLSDVEIDSIRIHEIFHNLIDNAVKYSPADSEIKITAKQEKQDIIIQVTDHGKGISPEEQAKLFAPFERLRETSTTRPGMGLGLVVCKRLVEAHGGRIWVDSKPGLGTTFGFSLPLHTSHSSA